MYKNNSSNFQAFWIDASIFYFIKLITETRGNEWCDNFKKIA